MGLISVAAREQRGPIGSLGLAAVFWPMWFPQAKENERRIFLAHANFPFSFGFRVLARSAAVLPAAGACC
jgi:hypothetical protein